MGHGASCMRVDQFDQTVQVPSPLKRSSTPSQSSEPFKSPLIKPTSTESIEEENRFIVKRNADQYSSVWDYNARVSL